MVGPIVAHGIQGITPITKCITRYDVSINENKMYPVILLMLSLMSSDITRYCTIRNRVDCFVDSSSCLQVCSLRLGWALPTLVNLRWQLPRVLCFLPFFCTLAANYWKVSAMRKFRTQKFLTLKSWHGTSWSIGGVYIRNGVFMVGIWRRRPGLLRRYNCSIEHYF